MSQKIFLTTSVRRVCLIILCLSLFGCSGKLSVTEINTDEKSGTALNGVPFRVKQRYELKLYHLNPVTGTYKQVKKNFGGNSEQGKEGTHITMANMSRLFVLKFKGSALADSDPSFGLNPDGTLLNAKIDNKNDKSIKAVNELITQIDAFKTEKAELDKPPQDNLFTAALTKKHAHEDALAAQKALLENASESKVREARQLVEKTQLELELATAALKRAE